VFEEGYLAVRTGLEPAQVFSMAGLDVATAQRSVAHDYVNALSPDGEQIEVSRTIEVQHGLVIECNWRDFTVFSCLCHLPPGLAFLAWAVRAKE
jgi:hypothetical protein